MPPIALSDLTDRPMANVDSATGLFELSDMKYASCYCEENIYCMVRDHVAPERRDEFFVVFISNREKCVALNFQKASPTPGIPVYWDYHVILLHHPRAHPRTITVYDLDTTLPFGLDWHSYFERTCSPASSPGAGAVPTTTVPAYAHERYFKVVPAADYIRLFASTRAHMTREVVTEVSEIVDGVVVGRREERVWRWAVEPPAWPVIVGEEGEDTLERFLDFGHEGDAFGRVYGEREFMAYLEGLVGGGQGEQIG